MSACTKVGGENAAGTWASAGRGKGGGKCLLPWNQGSDQGFHTRSLSKHRWPDLLTTVHSLAGPLTAGARSGTSKASRGGPDDITQST